MRIQITNDELQIAVRCWLESQGLKHDPAIIFSVDVLASVVTPTPVPVPPVPIVALVPGHAVTVDPPLSATVQATKFGYNDPADNGIGFFTDPKTGVAYRTNNTQIIGASLPREVLLSTFLKVDDWRSQSIDLVWQHYAAKLNHFVLLNQPLLTIDSGGSQTLFKVPLVDDGPAAPTGNGLDLTEAAALALKTGGKALCTYCIAVAGVLQEIRGWDFKAGKVG